MDYICRDIRSENLTVEKIDEEIGRMNENQYRYGSAIDRPRLWDLLNEKKRLTGSKYYEPPMN